MIRIKHRGSFKHTEDFLKRARKNNYRDLFVMYAELGVQALSEATPVDTGKTAASWSYKIEQRDNKTKISWVNNNVNKGVVIALILQYGHGTQNGGWVQGRDYINPAIQPVFDDMVKALWGEVTKP